VSSAVGLAAVRVVLPVALGTSLESDDERDHVGEKLRVDTATTSERDSVCDCDAESVPPVRDGRTVLDAFTKSYVFEGVGDVDPEWLSDTESSCVCEGDRDVVCEDGRSDRVTDVVTSFDGEGFVREAEFSGDEVRESEELSDVVLDAVTDSVVDGEWTEVCDGVPALNVSDSVPFEVGELDGDGDRDMMEFVGFSLRETEFEFENEVLIEAVISLVPEPGDDVKDGELVWTVWE
jgi:hypothetical protein